MADSAAFGTAIFDYTPGNGLNNCGYLQTAREASKFVDVYEYEFADRDAPAVTANPGFEMPQNTMSGLRAGSWLDGAK